MPSINLKKAATASETAEVLLTLLKIYIDDEPVLYLCNNTENITSNGHVYSACAFSAILPDQSSEKAQSCTIQIDGVDVAIYRTIKRAIHHKITCDVAVILASTPDYYEQGPLHFILRNISAKAGVITADLYDLYIQDRKLTAIVYNPDSFPGLFY